MQSPEEEARVGHLRRQRNRFALLAALAVLSIGIAVPRRAASQRERKVANERLVELQAAVVQNQKQIAGTQAEIVRVQQELARRLAR